MITDIYPSGIVSIVSDTWDFWKVITKFLPELKSKITARDGKVVIRPDSGDPVKIIVVRMEINTKDWLIEKYRRKEKIKFIFFWGHRPAKDGTITASCFSQWWHAPFNHEGKRYATAEHWMMAKKAELFNDSETADKILSAKSPGEVKKLGRLVQGFKAVLWDEQKFRIVVEGNYHKFLQKESLRNFLLQTNERILVEASPVDAVWGIGLAADDENCDNPLLWRGENLPGFALMVVRDRLRSEMKL